MRREMNRRCFLAAAAAGLAPANPGRLIIDTHLEVWTSDPKFPFQHPEHPELKSEPVQAPIENEVRRPHQPPRLRMGQLIHQLLAS